MTAVRLLPPAQLEKNTQEFYSENEEPLCLADENNLADEFITIAHQA